MKKIIVITGASSGMGREFALQIDKKEKVDEIWVIARNKERLEELKNSISTKIVPISIDLTDRKEIKEKYLAKLKKEKPEVKILANCAGFGVFDHTENIDADILTNMVDLNVTAYVAFISYTLPYMKKGSKIMNISSCASFQPIPYINCYAATKAFVTSYSRALRKEIKYRGIDVLTVTPFWTKTRFFDRAIDSEKEKVVISYAAMYDPAKVMEKAIRDLYKGKEISCYGFVNNGQRILVRLLPKKLVMAIWMKSQKLDGTPKIR
ncbi:SDR family NAD(P)-dependent oxidoreductase [Candidatus Saccharibacteria bacterium]|jgi:short-subunit dehydrogenase|nr:SDR family NAD(P)-dependent oxidoreductase [Candidatus Saccharibacteria bacterium]MBR3253572.1 SDR family NAD(P)-dependent oxidoreductase [Candidatus Saccharibacteria bacterium]